MPMDLFCSASEKVKSIRDCSVLHLCCLTNPRARCKTDGHICYILFSRSRFPKSFSLDRYRSPHDQSSYSSRDSTNKEKKDLNFELLITMTFDRTSPISISSTWNPSRLVGDSFVFACAGRWAPSVWGNGIACDVGRSNRTFGKKKSLASWQKWNPSNRRVVTKGYRSLWF